MIDVAQDSAWHRATPEGGVHVFGAGGFARDLARALQARGVTVRGFLTSAAPSQPELDGCPVRVADAAALAQAPLWVGVFNRESHSDFASLRRFLQGLHADAHIVWPQAAYGWLQAELGFRFWLHPQHGYAGAAEAIADARRLFEDDASRADFDRVLAFRRDPATYAQSPPQQPGVQYLPDWLRAYLQAQGRGAMRIVDAGAYRGETLRELASLLPVEQAWTFEPDTGNHAALVQALSDWPTPATHVPAGLSDHAGFAAFTPGQGEASHFSPRGNHHVPVVALDRCLHLAPVNFIKLDVEGHELAALAGARATLQRERPTLAIAGYHRWDDLWRIPTFIAETGLGYRLRLGLHGHNSFDTVFYAY